MTAQNAKTTILAILTYNTQLKTSQLNINKSNAINVYLQQRREISLPDISRRCKIMHLQAIILPLCSLIQKLL